jgi:cobaltochelatase CobN
MLASVTFPEMDGLIDSIPVLSNKKEKYLYNDEEIDLIQPFTIEENLSLIMKRIRARIELNKIPNSEKKVGIILLNYPPGESNIGNAAYFDGLGSTIALIKEMKNQGYTINEPESCDILIFVLLKNGC